MAPLNVVLYGLGAMGSQIARHLAKRPDVKLVAAIDRDLLKIGRGLHEVGGPAEYADIVVRAPDDLPPGLRGSLALHATSAFAATSYPILAGLLDQGMDVVTITQELFFPLLDNVSIATDLDRLAKASGTRMVAVGVNPGFILDVLPAVASFASTRIESISGRRVVDFSPYGPDEMLHIGAGLSEEAFHEGVQSGVIGHIGLLETAAFVAHSIGLRVDEFRQRKAPIISQRERATEFVKIKPGQVCGFNQVVKGFFETRECLSLEMIGLLDPDPKVDGWLLGDHFRLEGSPSIDVQTKEEICTRGGAATAAVTINTIPLLLKAAPGFHTINELKLPHSWRLRASGDEIKNINENALIFRSCETEEPALARMAS